MEEILSLIFHGCELAKNLESNLPTLANQPHILSKSCDEIITIFNSARDRLNAQETASYGHMINLGESHESDMGAGVREWLRYSCSQAMDLVLGTQDLPESSRMGEMERRGEAALEVVAAQQGGGPVEGSLRVRGSGGEGQPMDVGDSGRGSAAQRTRRRRDGAGNRTVRMAAPRMGNTELPPEDGYTWRKYGQKDILGSRFPRGYYRCTHQKLYQCPAKKQVQRLDEDPYTFEVLYRGDHTCTISSTAPSTSPAPIATTTQPPPLPPPPSTSIPLSHWLSMDIKPSGEGPSTLINLQMYRELGLGGVGTTGGGNMVGDSGAGPSTSRFGREVDYQPVVDMADAMFNSASSSNNSMELIFSSMEDKREGGDKKN